MSNVLKVIDSTELVEGLLAAIYSLHDKVDPGGGSHASSGSIARRLAGYLRLAKPAISTAGAIAGERVNASPRPKRFWPRSKWV
jgi:hypothetical protein